MDVLLGILVLAVSVLIALVIWMARQGRVSARVLAALAGACSISLVAMLITDWPSEVLAEFWAEHSVVAGVLSTVLMLGIGFLLFEVWDVHEQEELDRSLTSAGMGGLVDHAVDVEVALALLVGPVPPDRLGWAGWTSGKPLRWLRDGRERLHRDAGGGPAAHDPRAGVDSLVSDEPLEPWRTELADQAVRRLLAAIRDWTPVIGRSRTGLKVLISFGELRNELMLLENCLDRGEHERVTALALTLRRRCRVLAHALETASLEAGAASGRGERAALREEVLESFSPLAAPGEESARRLVLRDDWSQQLASSGRALAGDTVSRPDSGDPEARSSR